MKRAYSGLERCAANHHSHFRSSTSKTSADISSPYRSQSEEIIAGYLADGHLPFIYEDELRVPQEVAGGSNDRIWHPDFHLYDSEIIVEYVGMPEDREYMKGIERKKEVYEQMGVAVVWLYPSDLWAPAEQVALDGKDSLEQWRTPRVRGWSCLRGYLVRVPFFASSRNSGYGMAIWGSMILRNGWPNPQLAARILVIDGLPSQISID